MKLKYIFASIVATLALAVSCQKEADHYLSQIKLSSSYVSLGTTGENNTAQITLTATAGWTAEISEDVAKWLSVSPASGSAGEYTLNFSAGAGEGRNATIAIKCDGKTQNINIIQGLATVSEATCAQVIAGPDSKTYLVTGVVTKIANTSYGNWYLNDGTGEVYIYGTLDKNGKNGANNSIAAWGIEVGDEITVQGPKTTYNGTVELVDVTVVKLNKSLLKVAEVTYPDEVEVEDGALPLEGGSVTVTLENKGQGLSVEIADDAKDWLSISQIDYNAVTFNAAANDGGDRSTVIKFKTTDGKKDYSAEYELTQKGAIVEITAADFNALEDGPALFKMKGVITEIVMDKNDATKYNKYGNFYIQDGTGVVYVYGLLPEAGGQSGQDVLTANGIKVGDVITIVGPKGSYKDAPQMVNAYYEDHTSVTPVTAAEFNALPDDAEKLYLVEGTISSIVMDKNDDTKYNKYGNFYIKDETGEIYVYGLVPSLDGKSGTDMLTTLGIKPGDKIAVVGPKSSYKESPQMVNAFLATYESAE